MLHSMPGVSVSIVIDAPPDRVWQVLEPLERHVDWMADAVAIRFQTDQTRGVGTRFLCDTKIGPIRLTDAMEITAWQPGRTMGVVHSGLVTGRGEFTLVAAPGGRTTFCWDEVLTFPWWLGGAVGERVGGRFVLRPIWKRNLKMLKRLVESAPSNH